MTWYVSIFDTARAGEPPGHEYAIQFDPRFARLAIPYNIGRALFGDMTREDGLKAFEITAKELPKGAKDA